MSGDDSGIDGHMALRLITDHIAECTEQRRETKEAIKDVRDLLIRVVGGLIVLVVTFAGWQYVQNDQLHQAQMQTAVAASALTMHKMGETPNASSGTPQGNATD